jgi:N4-(beta-N-acetylglucosaminyl)-L-asparaginase
MVCGAFLTVEFMRQGMHPKDAALATLKRVVEKTPPRLLRADGRPNFGLNFYAVNKAGEFGGASFTRSRFAVCDEKGARHEDSAALYE